MGLFDPPTKNIAKRVPAEVRIPLGMVQAFAEESISDSYGSTIKPCLVAMVMAAWVDIHCSRGEFEMSQWDISSVRTTYKNCERIVGQHQPVYVEVINKLIEL